ncbi:hypothetical protein ABW21_db0203124 [Orbilia brochopaga]|nr:hypothetical protein ABW21_db0203124 [Drechslerella brochopaga]
MDTCQLLESGFNAVDLNITSISKLLEDLRLDIQKKLEENENLRVAEVAKREQLAEALAKEKITQTIAESDRREKGLTKELQKRDARISQLEKSLKEGERKEKMKQRFLEDKIQQLLGETSQLSKEIAVLHSDVITRDNKIAEVKQRFKEEFENWVEQKLGGWGIARKLIGILDEQIKVEDALRVEMECLQHDMKTRDKRIASLETYIRRMAVQLM